MMKRSLKSIALTLLTMTLLAGSFTVALGVTEQESSAIPIELNDSYRLLTSGGEQSAFFVVMDDALGEGQAYISNGNGIVPFGAVTSTGDNTADLIVGDGKKVSDFFFDDVQYPGRQATLYDTSGETVWTSGGASYGAGGATPAEGGQELVIANETVSLNSAIYSQGASPQDGASGQLQADPMRDPMVSNITLQSPFGLSDKIPSQKGSGDYERFGESRRYGSENAEEVIHVVSRNTSIYGTLAGNFALSGSAQGITLNNATILGDFVTGGATQFTLNGKNFIQSINGSTGSSLNEANQEVTFENGTFYAYTNGVKTPIGRKGKGTLNFFSGGVQSLKLSTDPNKTYNLGMPANGVASLGGIPVVLKSNNKGNALVTGRDLAQCQQLANGAAGQGLGDGNGQEGLWHKKGIFMMSAQQLPTTFDNRTGAIRSLKDETFQFELFDGRFLDVKIEQVYAKKIDKVIEDMYGDAGVGTTQQQGPTDSSEEEETPE